MAFSDGGEDGTMGSFTMFAEIKQLLPKISALLGCFFPRLRKNKFSCCFFVVVVLIGFSKLPPSLVPSLEYVRQTENPGIMVSFMCQCGYAVIPS